METGEQKFTIEEIRIYLMSQDSLGDIHYNLSVENILKAIKKHESMESDEEELS